MRHLAVAIAVLLSACAFADEETSELDALSEGQSAAWEEAATGKADSWSCSGVVPPDLGPFDHRIALTFDDGPSLTTTPQVLDILEAHGVRATFFINGKNVTSEAQRDLLAEVIRRGHRVGNHTQNHLDARTLSMTDFVREVQQTADAIAGATGAAPSLLRFPYGASSCALNARVRELGYTVVGWYIDSADWCFAAGGGTCRASTFRYVSDAFRSDMTGWVRSQARGHGGGIVLFHDIHQNTVDHLDAILTGLEADGFELVDLSDAAVFPLLNGAPPPRRSFVGDACASETECAFEEDGARGSCATFTDATGTSRGFCTLRCAGYCPDRSGRAPTFCIAALAGPGGMCASKSSPANLGCAIIPGTQTTRADRFVGDSGAVPAEAEVCLP